MIRAKTAYWHTLVYMTVSTLYLSYVPIHPAYPDAPRATVLQRVQTYRGGRDPQRIRPNDQRVPWKAFDWTRHQLRRRQRPKC